MVCASGCVQWPPRTLGVMLGVAAPSTSLTGRENVSRIACDGAIVPPGTGSLTTTGWAESGNQLTAVGVPSFSHERAATATCSVPVAVRAPRGTCRWAPLRASCFVCPPAVVAAALTTGWSNCTATASPAFTVIHRDVTLAAGVVTTAAWPQQDKPKTYPPITETRLSTSAFAVALRSDTQTLAQLSPKADAAFSFVPTSHEAERAGDGYVHIGDLNLRLRTPGGAWRDFASSHHRLPIEPLAASGDVLAGADITATMGPGMPLHIERTCRAAGDAAPARR